MPVSLFHADKFGEPAALSAAGEEVGGGAYSTWLICCFGLKAEFERVALLLQAAKRSTVKLPPPLFASA
jgi:hypothetical protein